MAALAGLSYVTWQVVPHSLNQVPKHLSHCSGQYPSDTPESWDNGQPGWVPYCEGLPIHFGGLSIFSGDGPPYDHGRAPWLPRKMSPWPTWTPWWRYLMPPSFPGGGP